jgi:hypothetical protein
LLVVGSVCEDVIHSLNFRFSIYKIYIYKNLRLHYGIFSFGYLLLILIHVERLHFIEILEVSLKVALTLFLLSLIWKYGETTE